ncbi:FadR/GntR family transcriptional regulator [Nocardia sp. NPDC004711]
MMPRNVGQASASRVQVPKTADVVAAALRREILRNELYDADLLTEAELMEKYGVSRPSLREALRVLESEKLVVVRRGKQGGVKARRPSVAVAANYLGLVMQAERITLADVYTARVAIEPQAVRLLADSPQQGQALTELRGLLAYEAQVIDNPDAYGTAVTHFHQRLVELSGNKTLALLWGTLQHVLAGEVKDIGTRVTATQRAQRVEGVEQGLSLIEAGDADKAEQFWRIEMTKISKKVLQRHGAKTVVDVLGEPGR